MTSVFPPPYFLKDTIQRQTGNFNLVGPQNFVVEITSQARGNSAPPPVCTPRLLTMNMPSSSDRLDCLAVLFNANCRERLTHPPILLFISTPCERLFMKLPIIHLAACFPSQRGVGCLAIPGVGCERRRLLSHRTSYRLRGTAQQAAPLSCREPSQAVHPTPGRLHLNWVRASKCCPIPLQVGVRRRKVYEW